MLSTRAVPRIFFVVFLALVASGCSLVGGIFKAGFWTAIILVAILAVGLMFLVAKMRS